VVEGAVRVFAVIGVIALTTTSGSSTGSDSKGSAVTGTIIAVLGVLFVVMAIKQWVGAPDPDAGPPKFMTALDSMSAPKAAVLGLIIAVVNVKQLGIFVGGVAQIVHADVSTAQRWVALVILLVVIQIGVIGMIVVDVVARDWAGRELAALRGWLVRNNRVLGIVLGLAIGVLFTVKGVAQIA
jgi:threonine/homoserine/homoserine lactone efflux protein